MAIMFLKVQQNYPYLAENVFYIFLPELLKFFDFLLIVIENMIKIYFRLELEVTQRCEILTK